MDAPSRTPALPGLPVQVIAAGVVEPGDLLLGPDLLRPTRVWWRMDAGSHTTVLLAGSQHSTPSCLDLPADAPVTAAGRGMRLSQVEQTERVLSAARGALWLIETGHPDAPDGGDLAALLRTYLRLTGATAAEGWATVRDGMPGDTAAG